VQPQPVREVRVRFDMDFFGLPVRGQVDEQFADSFLLAIESARRGAGG
jgi:hypothetical protein